MKPEKIKELEKTMSCNCDLDNWVPETNTGHSWVCRIHKAYMNQPEYSPNLTRAEMDYDNFVDPLGIYH